MYKKLHQQTRKDAQKTKIFTKFNVDKILNIKQKQRIVVHFLCIINFRVGQHSLPSRGAWQQVLRLFHYRQQRKEIKHHNYESGLHRITSYCIKRLYDICLVWAPETAADKCIQQQYPTLSNHYLLMAAGAA